MPRPLRKNPGSSGIVRTTVDLPERLWEKAKVRALKDRTDFRSVVIAALRLYLEGGR